MNKDFGEWYRLAGIEPTGEVLSNRWSVIENYLPEKSDVIWLVQLFYRLGKPDEASISSFIEAFQLKDPAFKIRENSNELAVLAGAQLIKIIEGQNTALADLAALALVSSAASNLRPGPTIKEIPEAAARYLGRRSIERGDQSDDVNAQSTEADFLKSVTDLGAPHAELVQEIKRIRRRLGVVTEEANILWWLFSEFSRDADQRWLNIPFPAVALMAGKELADLTVILPGPAAANAFLDRVIRSAKPKPPGSLAIEEAIDSASLDWRRKYSESNCPVDLEELLPVGLGIKTSLSAPENHEWSPAFRLKTGIAKGAAAPAHALAHQVFIESLLCQAWRETD